MASTTPHSKAFEPLLIGFALLLFALVLAIDSTRFGAGVPFPPTATALVGVFAVGFGTRRLTRG